MLAEGLVRSAQDSVTAIATDVADLCNTIDDPVSLCECALLFAYLAEAEQSASWNQKAIESLNLAIERVSVGRVSSLGLYGGLSEIGWIIEHVRNLPLSRGVGLVETCTEWGPFDGDDDPISEIDEFLIRSLATGTYDGSYDLINGLVGIGIYFLERLPRDAGIRGVELILKHLYDSADIFPSSGATWFTSSHLLPKSHLAACPGGYYNLGVAHGVPAVVYFLAETFVARIQEACAKDLLNDSVKWLLEQQRSPCELSRYGNWMAAEQEQGDSRLRWCYGDLGISAVLHHVAARVGNPHWQSAAEALSDRCLVWPREKAGICDAQLCHGAMGVAHVFSRIYHLYGNSLYKVAANAWFEQGLAMRRSGVGIGGFCAWNSGANPHWTEDRSFLSGGIGISLALLAAITPIEPEWDRLLVLSGRQHALPREVLRDPRI